MFEQLKEIILNYVEVDADSITEDSRFIEDLGFNSYDFMSLLGELEQEFDITVDENMIPTVSTSSTHNGISMFALGGTDIPSSQLTEDPSNLTGLTTFLVDDIIAETIPIIAPSTINGLLINLFVAPIYLIMSISRLFE